MRSARGDVRDTSFYTKRRRTFVSGLASIAAVERLNIGFREIFCVVRFRLCNSICQQETHAPPE